MLVAAHLDPSFRSSNRAGFRCSVRRFGCWRLEAHPTALEKVQALISAGKDRLLDIHESLPVRREQARFSLDQAFYCRRGKWSRASHCHSVCGGIYGEAERPRMASLERQNVHNADSRVTALQTTDSHVIVIVRFDHSAASLCILLRKQQRQPCRCSSSSAAVIEVVVFMRFRWCDDG